jgi:hypothetical protein
MAILILFAATLVGGYIFPWWWPAVAAYAVGFWIPRRAGAAMLAGFVGTALAWAALAGFLDWRNHQVLSSRMAQLFHLPSGYALVALTGILGGLMGGLAAWAGFALRAYLRPRLPETPAAAVETPADS